MLAACRSAGRPIRGWCTSWQGSAPLRSAWRASVLSDEQSKGQGNAMAAFHDYHLFPSFQRLEDTKLFKCANGHSTDDEHATTDRDLFPEGLEEASEEEQDRDAPEEAA